MGGSFGGHNDHVNRKLQGNVITAVEVVKTEDGLQACSL